ncbi:Kinesin-associated protein 3 [Halotydeus destructor]|nr:Kinesin-associated protein 3 [Halotydeus destructor]
MDPDEVKFIQKRINATGIDAHPTEDAIVITYELEASLVGDLGDTMLEENKECQKIIRLKSLQQSVDLNALALEVVKKSGNLILMSQLDEVRRLLTYIKSRNDQKEMKMGNLRPKTAASSRSSSRSAPAKLIQINISLDPTKDILSNELLRELKLDLDGTSMRKVDDYIEHLYDNMQDKLKGAALILYLARNADNLAELTSNERLVCALVRTLREDGRKSLELSALIVGVFACFSTYSLFHPIVIQYKFGSQCLETIQQELSKEETWFREVTEIQATPVESMSLAGSMVGLSHSTHSISSAPGELIRGANSPSFAYSSNDYEKSLKKYQHLVRKQNLLLRAAFYLLLNLSEDKKVEVKMVNKGIVGLLVKSLEREATPSFFVLIITMLKKLSVHVDNKNQLQELGVVEKLYSLLNTSVASESNTYLVKLILELLVNLSFDLRLRTNMIKVGLLQKLVFLLTKERLFESNNGEQLILQILYQMSREDRVKEMFNFALGSACDTITFLINKVLKVTEAKMVSSISRNSVLGKVASSERPFFMELMALVINLAVVSSNAIVMSAQGRLTKLLERAIGSIKLAREAELWNVLLLKLIRNISHQEEDYKFCFVPFVDKLMMLAFVDSTNKGTRMTLQDLTCSGSEDDMCETTVVECLGILGNLVNIASIQWLEQVESVNAFDWMKDRLKTGSCCEDDQVLDISIFLATCCIQEDCALYLISQNLIPILVELLNAKQEDDEIVLQVIYVFQVLTCHLETRGIVKNSQVPAYLLDLMNDKNTVIKQVCSATLDAVAEMDAEWATRIQMEKFKAHNRQWLDAVQSNQQQADYSDDMADDYYNLPVDPMDGEYDLFRPEMLNSSLSGSDDSVGSNGGALFDRFTRNVRQPSFGTSRPQTSYKRRSSAYGHFAGWSHHHHCGSLSAINEHTLAAMPRCSPYGQHPIFMPIQSRIDLSMSPSVPSSRLNAFSETDLEQEANLPEGSGRQISG